MGAMGWGEMSGLADIREIKKAARRAAMIRRAEAAAAAPGAEHKAMLRFLEGFPPRMGEVVSGYIPMRSEIDCLPLMEALHGAGCRLCAPVIPGPGRPLRFREWTPGCEMREGTFGAMIPARGAFLKPTLLIAPLLSWDRRGYRLGYGGGFYDRTLEALRALRPTRAVALAYAAQEVEAAPIEPTDQSLDGVATETEIVIIGD